MARVPREVRGKVVDQPDMVNQPPHYTHGGIECIDAIEAQLGPEGFVAFLRGTIAKYNWRMLHKGQSLEDAMKLRWYTERLVKTLESPTSGP